MARTLAERTAWVRQFVRTGRDDPGAGDLRVEAAVDLRRRVAVVAEAAVAPEGLSGFETARLPARDLVEAFVARRTVVYAGGSRYVVVDGEWTHVAGSIEGPRRPADPVWLLDALRHAVGCAVDGGGEIVCRLDLSAAADVDCSEIVPASRWFGIARRRKEDWLARVPCVVAVGRDGMIARMSFAGRPPSEEAGLQWRRRSSSSTACRSRSRTSLPGCRSRCSAGPEPRARYQVKPPATALDGRGMGRTTGRMWVWRPVRWLAVMVAGLLGGVVRAG